MTVSVDVGLYPELQRFGAKDISACFSCGTCTATCPMVDGDATFPRRMIRYAQVGMKEALLSSKEIWDCYHCGECSETCPTQADPGEFMAAARRYAIASYDRTRIARTMYTQPILGTVVAILLAAFFALFMYSAHGPQSGESLAIFSFIPEDLIHNTGIVVMVLVALAGLAGVVSMARSIGRREGVGWRTVFGGRAALARTGRALWSAIGRESLGQVRFRTDCDEDEKSRPLPRRRWFIHAVTVWGFLGLLSATVLDYGLALLGIKATGAPVPIWYPGPAAGHGRRADARLRRHGARDRSGTGREPLGPAVHDGRLDAPRPALGHRRDRLRARAGPVHAERTGVGLLGVPRSRCRRPRARAPGARS